ncbi:hypothetical protein [Flavobacterium capsici]|uniref:Beta/gamma crystallin 'Greek key' domain-containing protein n=1 Tax=Flavobacterium capsici TaxID=3075618 RepID=A0AA96F1R7_9FLAO|nr:MULTISPECIES: hypothetical protein [unclassified Flavobacterium]WNM18231.1 hypothetical protein RN608_09410 [Flavobacterium sp. PMR2A8]WNM22282.1 hypothetical protein RN605_02710 [Flavobacterium sp. PMTSA4]
MKKLSFLMVLFCTISLSNSYSQNTNSPNSKLTIDAKTNCYLRYYYFPNLEAYFDLQKMVYYYKLDGVWNSSENLPQNYGGYSLYNKARVIINDYDDDKPYELIDIHKKNYPYNSKGHFNKVELSSN